MAASEMREELWLDVNEPQAQHVWEVFRIQLPHERKMNYRSNDLPCVYVSVDPWGQIQLEEPTHWFGQDLQQMSYDTRKEIYEWLVEWEYVEWHNIGPEDRELFACPKLIGIGLAQWRAERE